MAQLDEQLQRLRAQLVAQQRLLDETEGDRRAELQRQAVELQVEIEVLQGNAREQLEEAESEIYLNTYRRVRAVIAEYAQENGIHTVRRVRNPVSEEDMDAQAVLEWINRDIVYSADEPRDITQDIIERLNAADAQANGQTTNQPVAYPPGTVPYPVTPAPPGYVPPTVGEPIRGYPPGTAPMGTVPGFTPAIPQPLPGSGATAPTVEGNSFDFSPPIPTTEAGSPATP